MKQAQNVVKPQKWYKPLINFFIGYFITLIPQLFLIYNYLSYTQVNGVSNNTLLDFGNSLMMLFMGNSSNIGFSFDILKSMISCYYQTWYYQILIIILVMLTVKKPGNFKGIEHGSARWGTEAERKKINKRSISLFKNIKNYFKYIVVQMKELEQKDEKQKFSLFKIRKIILNSKFVLRFKIIKNSKKCLTESVGYPLQENLVLSPKMKGLRNFNELVIGDSGTGKTFYKLVAELMQCFGNYVVVDVKGALYKYCAKFLKQAGYTIKILNLIERSYSNTYNPLAYCKSQDDVDQLVETFIINSRREDSKSGDGIWEDTSEMLLKSVISYLFSNDEEEKTFARVLDLILSLKLVNGNISPLSEFEVIIENLRAVNPFNPSVLNYDSLKQSAGETMQGVLVSLTSRLRLWTTEEIRILTMSDEMNIEDLLKEKQIIFLNMPQRTGVYKTISSMFLTQLFDTLYRLAEEKFAGKLKVPVNVLLDEFANCGTIPKFDSTISTCRSYNIRCVPCIQNKQQLEKLYNKADKTIMSNCSILNYLGTSDDDTQKMISAKLGKTTIEEVNRSRNITGGQKGGGSESDRGMGRALMEVDELNNMKLQNSIVFIGGFYPFFGQKYQTQNHKLYSKLGYDNKDNPNNTYAKQEYEELSQQHKAKYYKYISSSIKNNESIFPVLEKQEVNETEQRSGKTIKRNEDEPTLYEKDSESNQDDIRAEIEESIPQEFSFRDKLKNKMM
jgi:type IV secretion system protein VirD4